ncbi:hypothetical protein [Tardiphaga sp. 841_E9_N1_2]|uniref:hypothetical protein n=1 Tax=Tardiphaga sp. 841_E9_N1_2 TaxID=3240762 RepID=UPI003F269362
MSDPVAAIMVGQWSILTEQGGDGLFLLSFEFSDKPPINLAMSRAAAEIFAQSLLDEVTKPPATIN